MVVCFTGNRVFGRLSDVRLGSNCKWSLVPGGIREKASFQSAARKLFSYLEPGVNVRNELAFSEEHGRLGSCLYYDLPMMKVS
jgi:hypothetical protein